MRWQNVALLARLRLVAQQRKHLQSIPSSKLAVARRREMQMVGPAGTSVRGNEMRGWDGLRQLGDNLVHARARAVLIRGHESTGEQRHFAGFEIQIFEQAFVNAAARRW